MTEIFAVHMDRLLDSAEFACMMRSVSAARRSKVRRFVKPEDAQRALIGEMLVRTVIRGKFHISNEQIAFAVTPYGKPYAPAIPSFHFNVSHSGQWIVCATDCHPVGVDIERIGPACWEVAERCFSQEEYRSLMEKKEAERASFFYELWTLKESYVKQTGKGLSVPLASFSVRIGADRQISLKTEDERQACFFKQFHIDPGYAMAVCSATGAFSDHVALLSYDDLLL